jgi:hypothetical protein
MTIHEAPVGATVEWYTPASLFDRLGNPTFDLDPAAAPDHAFVKARRYFTETDDGLWHTWTGHVWLNPPYGRAAVAFVTKMIVHGDGLLLLPSRTETDVYQRALTYAATVCLLRDRLWFVRSDAATGRSSFGSTLFAFGDWAADLLLAADLGWCVDQRSPDPRSGHPRRARAGETPMPYVAAQIEASASHRRGPAGAG